MVINSPCLTDKKELAIPGQTATGKEFSNPLMAGSLPKYKCESKTVYKEGGDGVEGGYHYWMLSLVAAHDSDNIIRTQTTTMPNVDIPQGMDTGGSPRHQETIGGALAQTRSKRVLKQPNEPPLPEGHTSRSGEGRMAHTFELMDIVPPIPHDSPLLGGYTPGSDEETIAAQRKFRATQRAVEIRSKPPIKTQLRNMMITYLKNMGKFNHNQLKGKSYEELQRLYEREKKWINDFVPMDSEKEEKKSVEPESEGKKGKRIKRVVDSALKQKSSKKQKMMQEQESAKSDEDAAADYEHEKEELRMWLTVVLDEEETADPEILSAKYPIVDWNPELRECDMEDLHEMLVEDVERKLEAEAEYNGKNEREIVRIMDFYKLVLLVQLDTAGDG
ncbi:hypothetical protein Tco_0660689 [Tanacetum coccineum]